jgi:hypothetical protein
MTHATQHTGSLGKALATALSPLLYMFKTHSLSRLQHMHVIALDSLCTSTIGWQAPCPRNGSVPLHIGVLHTPFAN